MSPSSIVSIEVKKNIRTIQNGIALTGSAFPSFSLVVWSDPSDFEGNSDNGRTKILDPQFIQNSEFETLSEPQASQTMEDFCMRNVPADKIN
ncbi:MAG: hypothetical protein ACW99Q_21110 [Candidatus Kariarchaeaceae archaeon]